MKKVIITLTFEVFDENRLREYVRDRVTKCWGAGYEYDESDTGELVYEALLGSSESPILSDIGLLSSESIWKVKG